MPVKEKKAKRKARNINVIMKWKSLQHKKPHSMIREANERKRFLLIKLSLSPHPCLGSYMASHDPH